MSWVKGLGRTGGFYQDGDWYAKNMPRRMHLVPNMIEELVCSLPPLGDEEVRDLLSGCGTAAVEIKKAYPRYMMLILSTMISPCPCPKV